MSEEKLKKYRMNSVGAHGTTTVAIPPEIIQQQAETNGMTPEQFARSHYAVAHYDSNGRVEYTFEPIGSV